MLISLMYNPSSNIISGVLLKATNLQRMDISGSSGNGTKRERERRDRGKEKEREDWRERQREKEIEGGRGKRGEEKE